MPPLPARWRCIPTTVARVRRDVRGGGLGGRAGTQGAGSGVRAHRSMGRPRPALGRRRLLRATGRTRALDAAAAGGRVGAPGGGGDRLVRDGAADLKANALKPWLKEQWCIPAKPTPSSSGTWRTSSTSTTARRSHPAGRLPGRDQPPSAGRDPRAAAGGARPPGPPRSGVRAPGGGQLLPRHRAAARLAACPRQRRSAPGSTGRTASRSWSMSTIPTPSGSCW